MTIDQIELFKPDASSDAMSVSRRRDLLHRAGHVARRRFVETAASASPRQTQVNPIVAGVLTGGIFKSGAGPRGAALAAAIGGGLAAASHFLPGLVR